MYRCVLESTRDGYLRGCLDGFVVLRLSLDVKVLVMILVNCHVEPSWR